MTARPQSLATSTAEILIGSVGSIAVAQLLCWLAGIPLGTAIALNAGIYVSSFLLRLTLRRLFERRKS